MCTLYNDCSYDRQDGAEDRMRANYRHAFGFREDPTAVDQLNAVRIHQAAPASGTCWWRHQHSCCVD